MPFEILRFMEPDFTQERFKNAPDCRIIKTETEKVAPQGFHATSIYPEYFKINGKWHFAEDTRMDAVPVWNGKSIEVVEFRNLKAGDLVVTGRTEDGSEGIYVHQNCWEKKDSVNDTFAFRQNRTRETSFTRDYRELAELLKYEKEHDGYVVWVLGPACSFDIEAKRIMGNLIQQGYCQALLAGNALATHDLEGELLGTALGCSIETQEAQHMGHYNHLDTINLVNSYGSVPEFIKGEKIENGIIYNCVKNNVPFVLTGSIRDDGPLPEVYSSNYEGQDAIRFHVRKATTVIGMATMLHTIAVGNMTPTYRTAKDGSVRPVYFYMVDSSEFVANKLSDRGSLSAKSIVTNAQDFLRALSFNLGMD